jgi:hypothetical protein
LRDLPDAIHSSAVVRRRWRVSSVFADSIQSTYSRLWLGGKASNAVRAFGLRLSAARKYAGTFTAAAARLAVVFFGDC